LAKIKWHGDEFFKKLKDGEEKNLRRAGIHLKNEVKKAISDAYPPASEPDSEPHRRSGELRRSMAEELDDSKMIERVGTNKVYGRYLEMGTSKMEKRPFLRPTLAKERRTIARILAAKIRL
jgi:HK97 gp10 family phage protein